MAGSSVKQGAPDQAVLWSRRLTTAGRYRLLLKSTATSKGLPMAAALSRQLTARIRARKLQPPLLPGAPRKARIPLLQSALAAVTSKVRWATAEYNRAFQSLNPWAYATVDGNR